VVVFARAGAAGAVVGVLLWGNADTLWPSVAGALVGGALGALLRPRGTAVVELSGGSRLRRCRLCAKR